MEFHGANRLFLLPSTSHVDFQLLLDTTACLATELTKPLGRCDCFTPFLAQQPSKIQRLSGAALTADPWAVECIVGEDVLVVGVVV